ncbi:uncharacterized protein B0H18DRAFT_984072 [Fomitopsis serialis]|uniref:uncharacterized protein n=1 Tax=Fomitopsis serialis TaxID=139415 RepID=UPI002008DCD6|nr:uncharacterized protein B0H18DRAFT_984072 [Neoantrodia serialis]KAH9933502.1 hypothetical protein B0H18DRAFT_984072 [Neoantrodia serialis]
MYLGSINQTKLIWAIPYCAGSKVYVNSMMAVLNARNHLRDDLLHREDELSGFEVA